MRIFNKFHSVVAAFAIGVSTVASATVIDFEEFPHGDELQGAGSVISSKGYSFYYAPAADEPYPVGFFIVGPAWRYNPGSAALLSNSCLAETTLKADDNNPFDLLSIDLAELNGDGVSSVTFVGVNANGETVKEAIRLNGRTGWQRFHFPKSFSHLMSVKWLQGDCLTNFPHMFDNVNLQKSHEKRDHR